MNRSEKRGRNKPMIEITDVESAEDYAWNLPDFYTAKLIFVNTARMFITHQLQYLDIRDEFEDNEPCLL